jgi:hypothetical protein
VDDLVDVFVDAPLRKHLHIVVKPRVGESQYWHIVFRALIVIPSVSPPSLSPGPRLHHNLELNCFVVGDDATHIFSIEIANIKLVSALKDAIKVKKKLSLHHVHADALTLWKVSIPVNDDFKENARKVELREEEALSPVDPLSDVFEEMPARKHVHIMVIPDPGEY